MPERPKAGRVPRKLVDVLERVKKLIPRSWPYAPHVKERLVIFQMQASKLSPEYHVQIWKTSAGILSTYLDPVDCDWKRKVMIEFIGPEAAKRNGIYGLDVEDPGHGYAPPSLGELRDIKNEGDA